eukprot:Gb_24905 [translate_table: standard]
MALYEILVLFLKLSFIIHLSSLSLAHPSLNINSSFEDQQSLLSFTHSISYDPFNALQDWNSSSPFCNWTGVTCDLRRERVIELDLADMGFHGFLSPRLGNLSSLERLYLYNNTLGGHIPPQLGRLSRLTELRLEMNQLEGLIPPRLGQLTKLRTLYLDGNRLTGTIPSSLSNISTLTHLFLAINNLSGAIPPQLGIITQLEALLLAENQLTGQIPGELGATNLQNLLLWGNQLSGNIPSSLSNCSQLTLLDLNENRLSGTIPMELGQLPALKILDLWGNQLVSGSNTALPILAALTNCSHLQLIALGKNHLTGEEKYLNRLPISPT